MHCISLGDLKVSKDVLIFKGPSLGHYTDVDQDIFLCMKVEIVDENCFSLLTLAISLGCEAWDYFIVLVITLA